MKRFNKAKILWISSIFPTPFAPYGGAFVVQSARALQRQGVDVRVVCPVGLTPPSRFLLRIPPAAREAFNWIRERWLVPDQILLDAIPVHYLKWAWPPKAIFWGFEGTVLYQETRRRLDRILSAFRPDVIVAVWLNPDGVAACGLSQRYGIPSIVIAEGSDVNRLPHRYSGWERVCRELNTKASALVFVSRALQNAAAQIGLRGRRSYIIHNGVDADLFRPGPNGTGSSTKVILSVGRLSSEKGHQVLLEAFARLRFRFGEDIRLVLVGDGLLRDNLIEQSQRLGIRPSVEFVGAVHQPELVRYYQECNVMCLPSFMEGLPCVVAEAMACGKPVVASAVGGVPEIIDDGQTGLLVPSGDVDALSKALLRALEREWDSQAIRQRVLDHFTWDCFGEALMTVIETVVKESEL